MPLGGLRWRLLDVALQQFGVFVRRRVRGNELRARVQEEFLKRGDTLVAVRRSMSTL